VLISTASLACASFRQGQAYSRRAFRKWTHEAGLGCPTASLSARLAPVRRATGTCAWFCTNQAGLELPPSPFPIDCFSLAGPLRSGAADPGHRADRQRWRSVADRSAYRLELQQATGWRMALWAARVGVDHGGGPTGRRCWSIGVVAKIPAGGALSNRHAPCGPTWPTWSSTASNCRSARRALPDCTAAVPPVAGFRSVTTAAWSVLRPGGGSVGPLLWAFRLQPLANPLSLPRHGHGRTGTERAFQQFPRHFCGPPPSRRVRAGRNPSGTRPPSGRGCQRDQALTWPAGWRRTGKRRRPASLVARVACKPCPAPSARLRLPKGVSRAGLISAPSSRRRPGGSAVAARPALWWRRWPCVVWSLPAR